jgi:helicase MOV-10
MKTLQNRFESYGYCKMFERMLLLEDLTVRKALDDLTMTDKLIRPVSHRHFEVYFDGKVLSEKLGFNYLVLTPMSVYEKNKDLMSAEVEGSRIYNQITRIEGSRVVFKRPSKKYISLTTLYHVQLSENRMPSRLALKALEEIETLKLESFFTTFDEKTLENQKEMKVEEVLEISEWCNQSISENVSQMTAINHIVNRTSLPLPYIVFGPAGTGKTSTLVEAIAQIVKLQPTARILVTANSNAACDEIGERLLKFVPRYKMYRLYSPSFDISFPDRHMRLSSDLKPISNIKGEFNEYPSYEELYSYNVVISTLVNCGRLITASVVQSHFNYIFIDECASTVEPISIIPIALLGTSKGCINAQVILAGDHKQLQGMVHAYFNEKQGFGISLMERVMMLEKYQFPFNPRYVTQLTDNFRSHWAILRFSNFHFYHSVLQAKQVKEIADFAIGWNRLPNKCFPLIFHSILAASEMDGTSLFNLEEVHVVGCYVQTLLKNGISGKEVTAADIGIICPYGAQRKRLQEKFKDIEGLEIGTVDAFQGREKLIVIMSTVRSQTETVGFLKNEKRLNVALTRAKALLIVVGNGETLQQNKLWYKFLNYCYQNGALVGERFMLRYRKAGSEKKVEKPHPMFQMPTVAANRRTYFPILRSEAKKVEVEKTKIDPPEVLNHEHDFKTEDNENEEEDIDSESDWISDWSSASDSDVSWTHEDFRMKARTSKLKKISKVVPMRPRLIIDVRSKSRIDAASMLSNDFNKLQLDENGNETNNNEDIKVKEIKDTLESLKCQIIVMKSAIGAMVQKFDF